MLCVWVGVALCVQRFFIPSILFFFLFGLPHQGRGTAAEKRSTRSFLSCSLKGRRELRPCRLTRSIAFLQCRGCSTSPHPAVLGGWRGSARWCLPVCRPLGGWRLLRLFRGASRMRGGRTRHRVRSPRGGGGVAAPSESAQRVRAGRRAGHHKSRRRPTPQHRRGFMATRACRAPWTWAPRRR